MKRLILCLLVTLPFAGVRAAMLGADVSVMPPARWKTVEPYPEELAPSPFATLKYVPADGGPASITVTLMPPDLLGFEVTDAESLELFTRIAAQPFCAADEPAPKPVT